MPVTSLGCGQLVRLAILCLAILATNPAANAGIPVGLPRTTARLAAGDREVRIVCFGDSVTGIYYHTGGRRAYPEMLGLALQKAYGKSAPVIINAGISGNTTRDALARIERDVLRHRPQLVTVMFSLNDVVRVKPDLFAANLVTIIQKCREVGAEVLICTPNGVEETPQRPIKRIEDYLSIIKRVAQEQQVPLADCWDAYSRVRNVPDKAAGERAFSLMMSDEIHPNMSGHKLTAETIAKAVSGKDVSLAEVGPLFPSIPRTAAAVKSGKPISVLAMPPFDALIGPALKKANPKLDVRVTPWSTSGKTLAQLEQESKEVRKQRHDLVLVAIPSSATAKSEREYQRLYTWVLNWSLSFGLQEWDCIAVPASTFESELTAADQVRDALARKLILNQDLGSIERKPGDKRAVGELLTEWLSQQTR